MANSIGDYQAHRIMSGEVEPLGMVSEVLGRPGVSGSDVLLIGAKGEPYELKTMADYDSESDRNVGHAVAVAQRGRIVTVVDGHGRSWGAQLVRKVLVDSKQDTLAAAGGLTSGRYVLELKWLMEAV